MSEGERLRVVVVDDDEDHASMLEAVLETIGYDVTVTHSCAEAKRAIESGHPDALVADLTLGDGTAIDLMAGLVGDRPRFAMVLSGFDDADDLATARAAGFHDYLVKPTTLERLTFALARGLNERGPA